MVETWFTIFWIMVAVYVILDGRTLGAGVSRLAVAKTTDERRAVLNAIGPMWSWYEVWLVGAGGVLLLAFPAVLAAAFSGYYLALFLVLWLLVVRGISIEFCRQIDHPLWMAFWDSVLAASSALLIVLFGVAFGDIIRGVPIDERGEFHMAFFTDFNVRGHVGIIDWYTLSVGALSLTALTAHGSAFLMHKTSGVVHARSRTAGQRLWWATLALGILVALETRIVRPDFCAQFMSRPLSLAFLIVAIVGAFAIVSGFRKNRDARVFAGSCALIAGVLGARAAATFPYLLHSTLNAEQSISAYQVATRQRSLAIALAWWVIGATLAVIWHILATRSFRGTVTSEPPIPGSTITDALEQ